VSKPCTARLWILEHIFGLATIVAALVFRPIAAAAARSRFLIYFTGSCCAGMRHRRAGNAVSFPVSSAMIIVSPGLMPGDNNAVLIEIANADALRFIQCHEISKAAIRNVKGGVAAALGRF